MGPGLGVLVFLSGAAGLAYEILWAKYLALVLGGTAAAQAAVLAVFLGAMALGNAVLGAWVDRWDRPLRLYAALEAGIAFLGFLTPWAMGGPGGLAVVALSAALMGGTLPCLSRLVVSDLAGMARLVARLYFLNTVGAAAGAAAAGYWLVPALGLDRAAWAAAGANLAVAAGALRLRPPEGSGAPAPRSAAPIPETVPLAAVCAAALISGFVTLAYETAWVRLLALVLGSSVYSFAGMLAAFLIGLGAGAWWAARGWLPAAPAGRLMAFAQLGAGGALLLTLPAYGYLPFLFAKIASGFPRQPGYFPVFEGIKAGLCLALALPPTFFLGLVLPLACRAATREAGRVGRGVGRICALGALGNVAGALAGGLWLMPLLGLEGLLSAGAAISLALGACLLSLDAGWPSRRKAWAAAAALAAFVGHRFLPSWDLRHFAIATHRLILPEGGLEYALYDGVMKSSEILYYADGRETTVAVLKDSDGRVSLTVNGKADASTGPDMRTQVLLAQLPLLIKPEARDVLVVGLGSGVTAGSALTHPVRRLDVVEISREVVEASRLFAEHNGSFERDPRLRLAVEDAKAFLARPGPGYDVVISEPSNPWVAGMGALFTAEFYERVRERLNPGGLMVQWFHLYEMDDGTLRLVLRTFARAFPHVTVWHTHGRDVLVIGSSAALKPDLAASERALAAGPVSRDLSRIGIRRLTTLLSLQLAGDAGARLWAGEGPVNRDRRPLLEYGAPKAVFLRSDTHLPFRQEDFASGRREDLLLARLLRSRGRPLTAAEYGEIAAYGGGHREAFRVALVRDWLKAYPGRPEAYLAAARLQREAGDLEAARWVLRRWLAVRPSDRDALELAAELAVDGRAKDRKALEESAAFLKRLLAAGARDPSRARARLGRVYLALGEYRRAVPHLEEAARLSSEPDEVWLEAARLALDREDQPALLDSLERALRHNPRNQDAREIMDILLAAPARM